MVVDVLYIKQKAKNEDGEFAFTDDIECIRRNLDIIEPSYYGKIMEALKKSEDDTIMDTCICGRYISVIQLSKDNTGLMFFLDSYNDFDKAMILYDRMPKENTGLKKIFAQAFQTLFPIYEETKRSVELEFCS
jgi:hypothetical protein